MKQSFFAATLLSAALLSAPAAAEPQSFELDPEHTAITFSTHHLGLADVVGQFLTVSGSFTYDEVAGTVSDMSVTIQADSVFTNHDARDGHLRSDEFLDTENHPEITFVSTGSDKTGDTTGILRGDLTILGVTQPVELEVTRLGDGTYPFGDKHYAIGYRATTTVKRSKYGMMYGVEGGWVGDDIDVWIEGEAILVE